MIDYKTKMDTNLDLGNILKDYIMESGGLNRITNTTEPEYIDYTEFDKPTYCTYIRRTSTVSSISSYISEIDNEFGDYQNKNGK